MSAPADDSDTSAIDDELRMYPNSTADTSAGAINDDGYPDTAQDEMEADLGHSERFEDDGLRIRSKGRGKFGYYIGRIQVKELGYIDITDFSLEDRINYEQRSEAHRRYKDIAERARNERGGIGPRTQSVV